MNRTTRAQRINARYDKIWEEAARLKTQTRFTVEGRAASDREAENKAAPGTAWGDATREPTGETL